MIEKKHEGGQMPDGDHEKQENRTAAQNFSHFPVMRRAIAGRRGRYRRAVAGLLVGMNIICKLPCLCRRIDDKIDRHQSKQFPTEEACIYRMYKNAEEIKEQR